MQRAIYEDYVLDGEDYLFIYLAFMLLRQKMILEH